MKSFEREFGGCLRISRQTAWVCGVHKMSSERGSWLLSPTREDLIRPPADWLHRLREEHALLHVITVLFFFRLIISTQNTKIGSRITHRSERPLVIYIVRQYMFPPPPGVQLRLSITCIHVISHHSVRRVISLPESQAIRNPTMAAEIWRRRKGTLTGSLYLDTAR